MALEKSIHSDHSTVFLIRLIWTMLTPTLFDIFRCILQELMVAINILKADHDKISQEVSNAGMAEKANLHSLNQLQVIREQFRCDIKAHQPGLLLSMY